MPDSAPTRARLALLLPLVVPALAVAALVYGHDPVEYEANRPLIHRVDDFIGSETCRSCHLDHHESWERTYHRTMTQRPTPDTVVGEFDGREVTYEGQTARVFREDDRFFFDVPDGDGRRTAEVMLAVGSHRYQQYFEREQHDDGWSFKRLPFLWHIGERRWLALNSVFLGPDNPDWGHTRGRWNDNCVFCHNTGARPGEALRISSDGERQFDSEVAELGIACESCHGPGRVHAERFRDPLGRYATLATGRDDDTIVNPDELTAGREVDICGQCHGQRLPNSRGHLVEWLTTGPTYRSGDRLRDHVTPLARTTPSPTENLPDLFRLRFWEDGTPRLSAYEYQGIKMSPCHIEGDLKCGSCHTMHGGDPAGMIEPAMRGNDACTSCHQEIARDVRTHTGHDPEGSGSLCMECHMPRMVYGILEVHRSHRIENPDPARDAETGRPNACTLCHLDRSPLWAAEESRKIWGEAYRAPLTRLDLGPLDLPDSIVSMFSGDAVQRVVYAAAAGRTDVPLLPAQKDEIRLALAVTAGDAYPSVRWTARRSLLALEREWDTGLTGTLAAWDTTDGSARGDIARDLLDLIATEVVGPERETTTLLLPDGSINMERILALLDLQSQRVIDIGE
jgi:predicted CXXCH cytochrome family protein